MRSIRSSLLDFDPRRRRQSRATTVSKPSKKIASRARPEDPVALSPTSPRKSKSLHARTFGNKQENAKEGDAKADNDSQRRGRRTSVPLPTLLTSRRGRSRSKAAPKERSKSVTASPPASPTVSPKTTIQRAKSSSATKKQRSRSSRRYHYNSCYRGHERLHLVLARRTKADLSALLEELQRQSETQATEATTTSSSNQPIAITTVCVYADSPLFCTHNHCHYSQTQTRLLLQQVGVSFGRTLQHLQLDFSSEFGSGSTGLPLLTATLPSHTTTDNNQGTNPASTGRNSSTGGCILDCHLLASMLRQAPLLESLLLKEVVLEGDAQELRDALLHPLATTATPYSSKSSLTKIELKWCSAVRNNNNNNNNSIMSTLLSTLAEMPHLQELVLLVSNSHLLHDIIPRLATSPSIIKLTLGLEQRTSPNTNAVDGAALAPRPSSKDLRQQEQGMILHLLELLNTNEANDSWVSPLRELRLFSHHWTKVTAPQYVHALANLLGNNRVPSLETLVWVDYNYGTFQSAAGPSLDAPASPRVDKSRNGTSLLPLVAALKDNPNSRLRHFKVVTKQRLASSLPSHQQPRPESSRKQRAAANISFANSLKDCLETHASLQSVEIIHAGVTMNFPGGDISSTGDDGTIGTWSQQHQHHYGTYPRSIVDNGRSISLYKPCKACGATLASNPGGTSCTEAKHFFQYNKTMIAFLLMTNRLQARQRLWLTPSPPLEDQKVRESNKTECNSGHTRRTRATAFDRNAWVSFLSEHHDNTPLLYFLLRDNPTLIVDSAAAAAATAAANAAADRLAYAKLRSKSAGRMRRGSLKPRKGEEPIWESYF